MEEVSVAMVVKARVARAAAEMEAGGVAELQAAAVVTGAGLPVEAVTAKVIKGVALMVVEKEKVAAARAMAARVRAVAEMVVVGLVMVAAEREVTAAEDLGDRVA